MGFAAGAMVQELSGTLDALQDKPELIGHALELQESQKKTFPGHLLAERSSGEQAIWRKERLEAIQPRVAQSPSGRIGQDQLGIHRICRFRGT